MKKEYPHPNRLKEYHTYLKENDHDAFVKSIDAICECTSISSSSYYRKLEDPSLYSKAEKQAIAVIYGLPVHFIFPEMEKTAKPAEDV